MQTQTKKRNRKESKTKRNNTEREKKTVNDTNRIIMRSDLADAEIWGIYKFRNLATSFKSLAKKYIPAIINDTTHFEASENNFAFEIDFKNSVILNKLLIM